MKFVEKNSGGFGVVSIVAMVAVLIVLVGGGYFAYQRFAKPAGTGGTACTLEAKLCFDGKTYVSRTGPNCEFAPCPGVNRPCSPLEDRECTADVIIMCSPDGKERKDVTSNCSCGEDAKSLAAQGWKSCPPDETTPLDTSRWKTYRNEQYGFEVRYPQDYVAYEGLTLDGELRPALSDSDQVWFNHVDRVSKPHKPSALFMTVGAAVLPNEEPSLQEWFKQNQQYFPDQKITTTNFLGHEAILAEKFDGPQKIGSTCFFKRDNDLFILIVSSGEPLFDQILSTFKFIK